MRLYQHDERQSREVTFALLQAERLLVLMPGYAAPDVHERFTDGTILGNALVRCLAKIRRSATRQHVRFYRDFYANPRSPAYMAARLSELFGNTERGSRTVVADRAVDVDAATVAWASDIRRPEYPLRRSVADLPILARSHDAVLLVHADALGLGLGAVERRLSAAFPGQVFVLNGRRRLYRLDDRMRRLLANRRVLAETRIVEAVLGRLIPIAGWALALLDRLLLRKAA